MQVIAVGGCRHKGDFGTYAPGSYPAIAAAVTRELAVGLTVRHTDDWQPVVSEKPLQEGSLADLQRTGMVSERTRDPLLPPPFQFVMEELIGIEGRHVPMFLELPEQGTAAELAHLCRSMNRSSTVVADQIRLCSRRLEVLRECQSHLPDFTRIWMTSLEGVASHSIELIIELVELSGVSLLPEEINVPLVQWMSEHKVSVRLQTIENIQSLKQYGEWGVAGLFTNQPSTVLKLIQSWNTPAFYTPRRQP